MSDVNDEWKQPPNDAPQSKRAPQSRPRTSKEWRLLEKVVLTHSHELKRTRRWGIFFKGLTFAYLFILLYAFVIGPGVWPKSDGSTEGHLAIVPFNGLIGQGMDISVSSHAEPLRQAFAHADTRAVVLSIDSPGGSPVQADRLYQFVLNLRAEFPDMPVFAVVNEIAASGGYFIAAAAPSIYGNGASLVGSIGVISNGFGLDRLIDELGIDRRIYAAGDHKAFLDMFSAEDEVAVAHWQSVLDRVYEHFSEVVMLSRGDRINAHSEVLSGLIWSGWQAVEVGLLDGLESIESLQVKLDIAETRIFQPRREPWRELLDEFGISVGRGLAHSFQLERWLPIQF
jgi:protease-4